MRHMQNLCENTPLVRENKKKLTEEGLSDSTPDLYVCAFYFVFYNLQLLLLRSRQRLRSIVMSASVCLSV